MPRPKEFTVSLTAGDRAKLMKVVSSGRHPARMIMQARVLLALDESQGPGHEERHLAVTNGSGRVPPLIRNFPRNGLGVT